MCAHEASQGFGIAMRTARNDRGALRRRLANLKPPPDATIKLPRAASIGRVQGLEGGRVDDPEDRTPVLDHRDVDREFTVAADELLGSVERVDQPKTGGQWTLVDVSPLLLGHDRCRWRELLEAC